MTRTVSSTFRSALNSQETSEVYVVLLKINHADMAAPLYVCSNDENVVSNSDTYVPFPFQLSLVSEQDDGLPIAQLQIDNIDRSIVQNIRPLTGAKPTVIISIVLASDPNTIEAGPIVTNLSNISYDAFVVTGTLVGAELFTETYPKTIFNPTDTPAVFNALL